MSERDETQDTGGPLEPLPCPWCGDVPQCHQARFTGPLPWQLECMNADCPILVSVDAPTEAEAIAAWNRRTPTSSRERALLGEMGRLVRVARHLVEPVEGNGWAKCRHCEAKSHAGAPISHAEWCPALYARVILADIDAATKETDRHG